MKIKGLSNYENDEDTRFGDCILVYCADKLLIYDCGHEEHANEIISFLESNKSISEISIAISHNDSDHTNGIHTLLGLLHDKSYTNVKVYTSLYLRHLEAVEEALDDGRRSQKTIADDIIEIFDHINEVLELAHSYNYDVIDATVGVKLVGGEVVGPTEEEFSEVVATAIKNDGSGTAAGETVMNAASVQIKINIDNIGTMILCGDAGPDFLHNLDKYDVIQLPHHGQEESGLQIIEHKLDDPMSKVFFISDNTGSAITSGGSDKLEKYLEREKYEYYSTKKGVIELPNQQVNRKKRHVALCAGL